MGKGKSRIEVIAMNKTRISFILISMLLVCVLAINSTSCRTPIKSSKLNETVTPNTVDCITDLTADSKKITDFAVRLFKESEENGKNTLISPLSVLSALSLTANGAKGETLSQMEEVFGMNTDQLNCYLHSYMNALPSEDQYKLHLANSVWFTNDKRFTVNQDFLQLNADYFNADIYKAPFDNSTLKNINNWVSDKTDGYIENILDKIPKEAVMYLINALAFDAEWEKIYEKHQVRDGFFTLANGAKQKAEFMYSEETQYLEDSKAKGFIKYYKDRKYAFAALLPNEDISISEYIDSLNGAELNKLLANPQQFTVQTSIPKFETKYSTEMSDILIKMGIKSAFDGEKADFSGLGTSTDGNIFINRVLHKTFISVFEKGTKAGAATVVEITKYAALMPSETKTVHLDRPFVYMLIDCTTNIPFFIGTQYSVD